MKTRYTVQYWYIDERDTLYEDFDTISQVRAYASKIDRTKYKDITIYARHWHKVDNSFDYNGVHYQDWTWELANDDYFKEIPITILPVQS
jgi:hypothetical protein